MKVYTPENFTHRTIVHYPIGSEWTYQVDYAGLTMLAWHMTYPSESIIVKNGNIFHDDLSFSDVNVKCVLYRLFEEKKAFIINYRVETVKIEEFLNVLRILRLKFEIGTTEKGDKEMIQIYVETIPKVKFPIYPSAISKIPKVDMNQFYTIKNDYEEFKIHQFVLDDVEYFKSMMNFSEGQSKVIYIEKDNLESFYDFCYLDTNEWKERYRKVKKEILEEIIVLADYLNCEKFFNTVLLSIIENKVMVRDFLSMFRYSQSKNEYYQNVMNELAYNAEDYENMYLLHFKEGLIEDSPPGWGCIEFFDVNQIKNRDVEILHDQMNDEILKIFRVRITLSEEKISVYFFNLWCQIYHKVEYIIFKDQELINDNNYISKFFKSHVVLTNTVNDIKSGNKVTEAKFIEILIGGDVIPLQDSYFYTEMNSNGDINKIYLLDNFLHFAENPFRLEYLGSNLYPKKKYFYRIKMEEINLYFIYINFEIPFVQYMGYRPGLKNRCKASQIEEAFKKLCPEKRGNVCMCNNIPKFDHEDKIYKQIANKSV